MATRKTKPTKEVKTTRPTKAPVKAVKKQTSAIKTSKTVTPAPKKTSSGSSIINKYRDSATAYYKKANIKKSQLILAGIILLAIALMVYFRGFFVVATINGKPIDRLTYMKEVEGIYVSEARTTAGKQALNQLVTKTLLEQEAQKKNISVSEKDIDKEVEATRKQLEASGQNLESALSMQGDSLANYRERIKLQKLLEKLVGTIEVTDKEVADYVAKNAESIPEGMKEEDVTTQAKEAIKQEKFNTKVQSLIQTLQKNAKITYSQPQ